jgi:hypothetical protein
MNKDQSCVSSTRFHSRAKLTALAPVDSLPFYQRDAEAERYEGRGDQMWAKMSLYTIHQSKGVLSGSYIREQGLPGQESGGVIARALEPEYLK